MTELNAMEMPQAMHKRHRMLWLLLLLVLSVAALFLSCLFGSVGISPGELLSSAVGLFSGDTDSLATAILTLRAERAAVAFLTGASLALAGCMMQALLRNPLADPYVLGVSSGASVGAIAMLFFSAALWAVSAVAFCGALAVAVVLFVLSRRDFNSQAGTTRLLLTGVILAFGCSAVVTLLLTVAPDRDLRGMVFWLVGDLSATSFNVGFPVVVLAVFLLLWRHARAVNLMALHDDMARALGIDVPRIKKLLYAGGALLTAAAVTCGGNIGFVGLIVPHACRMAFGPDNRFLFPAALMAGGIFLLAADTLARTVMAPLQIPVGIITSLIGVPVFLIQLSRSGKW